MVQSIFEFTSNITTNITNNVRRHTIYRTKKHLVGGRPTPLKNMKVSWDDDIPNIYNIYIYIHIENKIHVPNHQPDIVYHSIF
jgi:hypothetical protein